MTYLECFLEGREALTQAGVTEAALDARLLLEHVCGTTRQDMLMNGDRKTEAEQLIEYRELIARRRERIPLQYLTGTQSFMGLSFEVNENVLIPRQDTEILAEEVLKNLHDGMRILDMCTGSGCILISLLHYSNGCEGIGADISAEALAVAWRNAEKLLSDSSIHTGKAIAVKRPKENNVKRPETDVQESVKAEAVRFIQSDLFTRVEGEFDVIVSNPPYIPTSVIDTLMPEVREHEPVRALDGSGDGLHFYRRIIPESRRHQLQGGMLFLEIGYDQAQAVCALMRENGYAGVHVVKDYAGLDRVVYGTCMEPAKRNQ